MKTRNIFLTATLGLAFFTQAQTTQNLDLSTFTKIDASGAPIVIYKTSDSLSLSITGKTEDVTNIETRVVDGTLFIKPKGNIKGQVTVRVNANKLNSVSVSGATYFMINNKLNTDTFMLESSGAGNFTAVEVNSKLIKTTISGASNVSFLSGTTESLQADISGASTLKAYKLISNSTSVTSSGAFHGLLCAATLEAPIKAAAQAAASEKRGAANISGSWHDERLSGATAKSNSWTMRRSRPDALMF